MPFQQPPESLKNRLDRLFADINESSTHQGSTLMARLGIVESEPSRGWIWEADSQGRYTWCSKEVSSILGYKSEDLEGRRIYDIALTNESSRRFHNALDSGNPINNLKLSAHSQDGKRLDLIINASFRKSHSGKILGLQGVTQVISIKQQSPTRLAVRVNQLPEEIEAIDTAPLAASWGFVGGYEDDGESVHPIKEMGEEIPAQSYIIDGHLIIPIHIGDTTIGVLEFDEHENGQPWSEDDTALAESLSEQLALTLQDVRSYQLTQQALDELQQADRLKTQFLANMTHELRTPLNSIIGFSRVILKGIDGPITETQEQDLSAISSAGQHLLRLINDILDLSKIEARKMELVLGETDLMEILHDAMTTASSLIKDKPIELVQDIPENLPKIEADSTRVRQILLNLISNAAKFTEKGHIGISARVFEHSGHGKVLIAVFDTGPGIAPEDQDKLFTPFSQLTTTRETGGTGLGLSISRHLVELHGGRIWVESMPDQGSTFAFTLPIEQPKPILAPRPPRALALAGKRSCLDWLQEMLESVGCDLRGEVDLKESNIIAKEYMPDAIIIDAFTYEKNLWPILNNLSLSPTLSCKPMLMVGLDPTEMQGVLLQPAGVLVKPIQRDSFTSIINRLQGTKEGSFDIMAIVNQQDDLSLLNSLLEPFAGIEVRTARDAISGLSGIRSHPADLLILDMFMPQAQGFRVLETLRMEGYSDDLDIILLIPAEPAPFEQRQFNRYLKRLLQKNSLPADAFSRLINMRLTRITTDQPNE